MDHPERAAGASASLNKTISELMDYMEDVSHRPSSDMRQFMYDRIADIAEWWANEGFYWAHGTAHQKSIELGEVPATLTVDYGNAWLAPGCERQLSLKSRIRRDAW